MCFMSNSRLCAVLLATASVLCASAPALAKGQVPKPDHVVLVMEENHSYSEVIGNGAAKYINTLAQNGALFTQSFAVEHPSQPNYLDLFSGTNQGVNGDACPNDYGNIANEESELIKKGLSFRGYSEGLPEKGSLVCTQGEYARKHVPWTNFTNDPGKFSLPFTKFSKNYDKLPTVSWIIPNLEDDMHDGTVEQGDTWLQDNIASYVSWVNTHNSLLIVTWDEDDGTENNQIATLFIGPMVKAGQYSEHINHYNVLRTIEAMYGLKPIANEKSVQPITDVWQ